MTRTIIIVLVLVAALGGYLYWASDERRIRRLLDDVTDAVTQEEGEAGVAGLAEVAGLNRHLAPDVTFEPGDPFRPITSAQDIVSTVGRLRAVMTVVRLEILDAEVIVDGTLAAVNANARLTLRDRDGAERVEARSVVVALEERDTGWIITSARALGVIP
jgi:hypothetical protein